MYLYYNALPEVAPYIDRDEFKKKIHFWVFDPTDFEYYQQPENQQRLRVIPKIIDPISLAETLLRNRAYRWKLHEKARVGWGELANPNTNHACKPPPQPCFPTMPN